MVVHNKSSFRSDQTNKMAAIWIILIGRIPFFLNFKVMYRFSPNFAEWLMNGPQQIYKISYQLNNKMAAKGIILIGWFSNIFFSETTGPNLTKLYKNDICMVLHKKTSFCSGWTNKMAARANSLFWLADFQKSSPLKRIKPNFARIIYEWSCTNFPHFVVLVELPKLPPRPILYFDLPNFKHLLPMELLGRIQRNFAGMMYGWSCTKIRLLSW